MLRKIQEHENKLQTTRAHKTWIIPDLIQLPRQVALSYAPAATVRHDRDQLVHIPSREFVPQVRYSADDLQDKSNRPRTKIAPDPNKNSRPGHPTPVRGANPLEPPSENKPL